MNLVSNVRKVFIPLKMGLVLLKFWVWGSSREISLSSYFSMCCLTRQCHLQIPFCQLEVFCKFCSATAERVTESVVPFWARLHERLGRCSISGIEPWCRCCCHSVESKMPYASTARTEQCWWVVRSQGHVSLALFVPSLQWIFRIHLVSPCAKDAGFFTWNPVKFESYNINIEIPKAAVK